MSRCLDETEKLLSVIFFKGLQLINIIVVRINYIFWGITDIRREGIKFITCDKFSGGFNVMHDSFESLLQ